METGFRFLVEDSNDVFDTSLYQQAVGCLIHACNTRPDIQYAVSQLSRFMHNPGTKHWQAVKRVFRYLKGTMSLVCFMEQVHNHACILSQIVIGLVVMTLVSPLVVIVSFLEAHAYLG